MNFKQTYQTLPAIFFQTSLPYVASDPEIVAFNSQLANSLEVDEQLVLSWLRGDVTSNGAQPIAMAYAGHQFGQLNRLGDGRATLLGEVQTDNGLLDVQLKGSGQTPYSQNGDGKANLAPMLREYMMSEAMRALGIPTTRGLAVIKTNEPVRRREHRQGAVLVRVASSHIRVGTFVYAAIESQSRGDFSPLRALLNYTLARHYPECAESDNPALALLEAVIEKQALLVAHWQRVGFVHGVMNTDNITVSGETIDYGPCAFMDSYHEDTVFSSIDRQGRYAFGNQPPVMQWNMSRFAESLLPLIYDNEHVAIELAADVIDSFQDIYYQHWNQLLCTKLGLAKGQAVFAEELLTLMQERQLDYTNTFVGLTQCAMGERVTLPQDEQFSGWVTSWKAQLQENSVSMMKQSNPIIVPRNHLVEQSLSTAESGNISNFEALHAALLHPYDWENQERYNEFSEPASVEWNNNHKTFCGT